MTLHYSPGSDDEAAYISAYDPSMQDLDAMINAAGERPWFNFVVTGTPKRISPEWLAKHPGWQEGDYPYGVSYSIHESVVGDMTDENATPLDAFNWYLENTGKEWLEIEEIKLVERTDPWEDTF
jgi:hypothetical protein